MNTRGQAVTVPMTIDVIFGRKDEKCRSRERQSLPGEDALFFCSIRLSFVQRGNKAKALAGKSTNQLLFSTIVANRTTSRIDADAENSI